MSTRAVPWHRRMDGRDPEEQNRRVTPLELFFDLGFVVAVAGSALALHHDLVDGLLTGLPSYLMVFFFLWWGWVGYTWFASAYDSGDVMFRLATFAVMTGALLLTAGIPTTEGHDRNFHYIIAGYVLMRLTLVPLWLRAARENPGASVPARRYAVGIAVLQPGWVLWALFYEEGVPGAAAFLVLAAAELAVPHVAERRGPGTPWHPDHLAERYHLFSIIVLGEVILAISKAISETIEKGGMSGNLLLVTLASLLLVFSLWWLYFKRPMTETLTMRTSSWFAYAHFFVFGSVAAVGAAIGAMVEQVAGSDEVAPQTTTLLLSGSLAVYLLALATVHALADRDWRNLLPTAGIAVLVVGLGLLGNALTDQVGVPALVVALVVLGTVLHHQRTGERGIVFPEDEPHA